MKIAVFPGSFDPITKGHEDIVRRALPLFDKIIVALGTNSTKSYYFSEEERLSFLKASFADAPKVEIDRFPQLTVDYCKEKGADFILRGLRNSNDFNYEVSIAMLNRDLGEGLETIFLLTAPEYSYYSSTVVREILKGNGDGALFVPDNCQQLLRDAQDKR
ncbi:pantetheine-phosphate adenylyltransferase [Saprospira sp. CCB-QB6]|uniref:pantetheine-phosphate adenylyltransferase n=1 Tax=Saprospira sp. CCB-QB6 TaxID=3023936 RepID=UPI00234A6CE8|nr:pantetheine-phosphate adenylyltransferase [Saprospira sp. CCB-QB6]WCL81388.1 pantetheine-phosphate adenylyltransferase [Saprospira sp. CCB-QB6]